MIEIETTEREDIEGQKITRYTPYLSRMKDYPCFTGKLVFAFWEVWSDDSISDHEKAILNAKDGAREVLRYIAKEV
jgi:hypothetical protein